MQKQLNTFFAGLLICATSSALANDKVNPRTECPSQAQAQIDASFGSGTSEATECLVKRNKIKTVVSWANASLNKSGVGQQVKNVQNLIENYEGMYDLEVNRHYQIVVVGYNAGARWLLTDEAYNKSFNVTTGNPSRRAVEAMIQKGIPLYMCQNTMKASGWVPGDLISGVDMVPAGVTAVVDYGLRGFVPLNP